MKLKFKVFAAIAAIGVLSSGFAAQNFAQPTSDETGINVNIETFTEIGTIAIDYIGQYNLASPTNPLVFTARYLEGDGGVKVEDLYLSYKIILNENLSELISFGDFSEGMWISDVPTSVCPTWNEGKNPTNIEEYNLIKNNLASYEMTVVLKAKRKDGTEPRPSALQLVLGNGVNNNMQLVVGESVQVNAIVLDQYNKNMHHLHPTGTVSPAGSASFDDGVLSALSVSEAATLTFAYETLDAVSFAFSIRDNKHSVTFIYDNGDENEVVVINDGAVVAKPENPVREGFTFIGWYNGSTPYHFDEVVNGEISLTAQWISGDFVFELGDDATYQLISFSSSDPTVTVLDIPETFQGIEVTSLGYGAFNNATTLKEITIPDSVTAIGYSAFNGCSNLTSVTLPNNLSIIQMNTFTDCASLTEITIPASVTTISDAAFSNCSSLLQVNLVEGLKTISNQAFYGCSNLESISLPNTVTAIGNQAFYSCSNLVSAQLSSNLESIGINAFNNCRKLAEITIPGSLISFGEKAFENCVALTSVVIEEGVTLIGNNAFSGCTLLNSVTIPLTMVTIGSFAFYNCKALLTVTIPSGVTSVGSYAFYGCTKLATIYNNSSTVTLVKNTHYNGTTVVVLP